MQLTDDGIVLSVQHADGRERTVAAQHLIAAVPPRILDETVDFVPALDSETRRSLRGTPTWMAPHAKLFAIYDRPFWREAGLSGTAQSMIGPMSEIHDATTASGQAALFGFIGVGARQRAAVGEAALTKACVSQLDRIFGGEAAAPRATLYKDWAADPMTATPADMDAPGHPSGRLGLVGRPWQGHLHLAGSEASPSDAGYLAGALETSNEAAAMVMKSLEGSAQS
jgi:monoamine oxidase